MYLPERALAVRREAIAGEGADVVVVGGTYEECVALARREGERSQVLEIADVGDSGPARDVIDGYATLFDELGRQAEFDLHGRAGRRGLAGGGGRPVRRARGHPGGGGRARERGLPDRVAGGR